MEAHLGRVWQEIAVNTIDDDEEWGHCTKSWIYSCLPMWQIYSKFKFAPIGKVVNATFAHRMTQMPAQISNIHIFATNTATATKFHDFSQNLSRKTMVCWLNSCELNRCHGNHFFESRFDNFHINLLEIHFLIQVVPFKFSMFLINFLLILSNFWTFQ